MKQRDFNFSKPPFNITKREELVIESSRGKKIATVYDIHDARLFKASGKMVEFIQGIYWDDRFPEDRRRQAAEILDEIEGNE